MRGNRKSCFRSILAVLLLGIFLLSDAIWVKAENVDSGDWMAAIADETKVSEISIPGTHDSATQYVGMKYIFQCQDTGIAQQLENGYRYLDLRIVLDGAKDHQRLILKHNFSKCKEEGGLFADVLTFTDVLEDVYGFLEEHPTETVILCMKAENSEDDVAKVQQLLYNEIEEEPDKWYLENEIPSIGEVRGKIILATRFEDAMYVGDDRSGLHFYWEDQGDRTVVDIPYEMTMLHDDAYLWVQDRYNYDTADKIDAVVDDLENCQASEDTFSLNFTSTSGSGKVGHPKKYASTINEYLLEYSWREDTCYGIVIVDFGTRELAACIYGTNHLSE